MKLVITFNEKMIPSFYNGNIRDSVYAGGMEDAEGIYWNVSYQDEWGFRHDEYLTDVTEVYKRMKELDAR